MVSPRTWAKRLAGVGSFTADQLAAGNAVLDAHSPADWPRTLAQAGYDEDSAPR